MDGDDDFTFILGNWLKHQPFEWTSPCLHLYRREDDSNERDVDDDVDDGVVDDVDVDDGQADENEKLAAMTMTRRGPGAQCRHHKSSPPLYWVYSI